MRTNLTNEHWLFSTPIFIVLSNVMFAGNLIYPAYVPKWWIVVLVIVLLYFFVGAVQLIFRPNTGKAVTRTRKNSSQTVAGVSVSITAVSFVAVAALVYDRVPLPLVQLYLLATFVSAVLFAIGERSSARQQTEERFTES